jgi:hypothetical protein
MGSKGPDWSRTGTIVAYAEWLRSKSEGFAVIVLRRDDGALAVDPDLAPRDVRALIDENLSALLEDLARARREKRKGARVELRPCPE